MSILSNFIFSFWLLLFDMKGNPSVLVKLLVAPVLVGDMDVVPCLELSAALIKYIAVH